MKDNFEKFAPYYDILYSLNAYEDTPGELKFFLNEAKKAKGKVLEIGCGTGRIYLPLLASGIDIEGVDISKKMLNILKEKSFFYSKKAKVKQLDMLKLNVKNKYKLIIIPLNSIHHLLNSKLQQKAFSNFYNALTKGGRLIFTNQFYATDILNLSKSTYVDSYLHEKFGITIDLYLKYNKSKNTLQEKFKIIDQNLSKPITLELPELYCYSKQEIQNILNNIGFENIMTYQNFDYKPHKGKKPYGIWVAKKV